MKYLKKYKILEAVGIIEDIKKMLIGEYGCETWKEFVNNQEIGDCQGIVASIIDIFPEAKKCFGEIEIDEYYKDEFGDEQNLVTHHWVEIDGEIYDFSKGTLVDHIDWPDLYEVDTMEEWRYNVI